MLPAGDILILSLHRGTLICKTILHLSSCLSSHPDNCWFAFSFRFNSTRILYRVSSLTRPVYLCWGYFSCVIWVLVYFLSVVVNLFVIASATKPERVVSKTAYYYQILLTFSLT